MLAAPLAIPKIEPMTMIPQPYFSLLLAVALFLTAPLNGQSPTYISGQVLISLRPGLSPEKLVVRGETALAKPLIIKEMVSTMLNIWLLETVADDAGEKPLLEWLRKQPEVRMAQLNHRLTFRGGPPNGLLPNDPLIGQQWHYVNYGNNGGLFDADLDAEQAWEYTTGGLSAAGDTIVVAVIDGGVDFQHPDLAANAWFNREEIPNDGLDNDDNGYIDDFRGWNVNAYNDNITGQTTGHGTPVCGILGARGNNGLGVSGVNWQVKIMFIAGTNAGGMEGTEAAILSAYSYILTARQRYNTSNGQHGAFVTAVNCSWGIDYGKPADSPLWCAAFDTLGMAGILSVAATANLDLNIDVDGDMPTACTSNYLVTVTSLQRNDQKASLAAWGPEGIDLGAYGQQVYTLGAGNTYGTYSGTSFAAPQVAGAIGLLYSMPCGNLVAIAKNDPSTAALWAKSLVLGSTTPNLSLMGSIKTGGRLNLYNLLKDYNDLCNPCPAPFSLTAQVNDVAASLSWAQIPDYQTFNLQYRLLGQSAWVIHTDVTSPFILPVSTVCQPYEFSLQAYCQSGQASAWSEPVTFNSAGCCLPPTPVTLGSAGTTFLTLHWPASSPVGSWAVRYRVVGSSAAWLEMPTLLNTITLLNLNTCTSYEVQIKSQCNGVYTAYSSLFKFTTAGCGSCTQVPYCTANASLSSGEWIDTVSIGNWEQISGAGGGGYQNFTDDQFIALKVHPLDTLPVTISPGFFGVTNKEFFRIYVDFNADGDFDDPGEKAFDPGYATHLNITGFFKTPNFTYAGFTRMRVLMKAKNSTNGPPEPCESFDFGQIEDYCVLLDPTSATGNLPEPAGQLKVFPRPANASVTLEWPEADGQQANLQVWNMAGQLVWSQAVTGAQHQTHIQILDWKAGMYRVSLQTERGVWQAKILKL